MNNRSYNNKHKTNDTRKKKKTKWMDGWMDGWGEETNKHMLVE